MFEVEEITSVMTASKDDVAAGRIVAECSKHFWIISQSRDISRGVAAYP
jgi:hypothetical protein